MRSFLTLCIPARRTVGQAGLLITLVRLRRMLLLRTLPDVKKPFLKPGTYSLIITRMKVSLKITKKSKTRF